MLAGPVLRTELLRTSRRKGFFVLRVVYGAVLLFLLWRQYEAMAARFPGLVISADRRAGFGVLAEFGRSFFNWFFYTQLFFLLALAPAFVAGVIADEKQRKTLHYLLASELTSREILFDKLAARLLHLGSFMAMGLPVVCLGGLLGGISPVDVAVAYGVTCAAVFFASALAILVSTFARKVRQAVLIAYLAEAAWFVAPGLLLVIYLYWNRFHTGPSQGFVIQCLAVSPLGLLVLEDMVRMRMAVLSQVDALAWASAGQVVLGLLAILVAMVQLRPTFRRQEAAPPRRHWFKPKAAYRPRRFWDPPACPDDAMLWKERYFVRTDLFTKLFVLPALVVGTALLTLGSGIDEWGWLALKDVWKHGWAISASVQDQFCSALRSLSAWSISFWLLAVAGATSTSITLEREQDTWVSLVSTPLSGIEIVRGKILGAIWGLRWFLVFFGLFWVMGLMTASLHPVGLLIALAALALLTWFVAVLGIRNSLRGPTTAKALFKTMITFLLCNGVFLLPMRISSSGWDLMSVLFTPVAASSALRSYQEMGALWSWVEGHGQPPEWLALTAGGLIWVALFGLLAAVMTYGLLSRFESLVDRPRRGTVPSATNDKVRARDRKLKPEAAAPGLLLGSATARPD
jgi:hypothetical protein